MSVISPASRRVSMEPRFNHCQSDAENVLYCGDGETGNAAEISSSLDDGILPEKRSGEPIVVDDNVDDSYTYTGVSDVSLVDSGLGREIPLDDVVGSIGQKRFWRAKHAISKQQRLFAKQVFELHRLVKVQRLIAHSPHLVFDDAAIKVKPSQKKEKLPKPCSVVKPWDNDDERDPEGSAENTPGRFPSLPQMKAHNLPSNQLYLRGIPMAANLGRSIQQSSGHHWLIPVMSPSEGLIYKPCPAPSSFGGWGRFSNFAFPPFGFPPPPPLLCQQKGAFSLPVAHPMVNHFPPYNMPVIYPTSFPGMHMDQRTHSNRSGSTVRDQDSCNMLGPVNGTTPPQVTRDNVRLEPRQQVEDASRRPSNLGDSDETNMVQPGRVVRAVPCNPRLAPESAARIFRSIQEERTRA
ncbi:PREDICTED: protein EARLY FLOWERING 3-like isoform X2 [Tarenaya hassleriana]|nr:PREDICTED: protein EARLY FLOWERING 3-like isoform X2 [Tarenaya hassleriana]XP_010536215.1 PREDICTED: protein EARLY FLOWERING 3-like isoform X2 [Tarenaya hassleriana]